MCSSDLFGLDEAHSVGMLIQYNWLLQCGAIAFRKGDGKLMFDPSRFHTGFSTLGDTFYRLSQTKSVDAAEAFKQEWGTPAEEVRRIVSSLEGIPVDIDPIFEV